MGDLGFVKRFPHPQYGNYGGYLARCKNKITGTCPRPIDWMDGIFKDHDNGISNREMVKRLWKGKSRLLYLAKPVYGQAYWLGTLIVFSIPALLDL